MTLPFRPLPLVDPTPPKGPVRPASPGESVHRRVLRLARQVQHPLGPAPRPNRTEFPYVGSIVWPGLPRILVETAAGQARHWGGGAAQGGGSTQMLMHYGEFEGTTGADGDPIDVYVGPERTAAFAFVVHQQHPGDRTYDEDKVMLGFANAEDALAMYRAHYDRRGFVQAMRRLSIVELADWLRAHGSKGGRIDGGQPLSKAEPAAGEVELEGADLEFLGLMHLVVDGDPVAKGAGHKYIRRVPKPGGGYRYYYAVTGGANLGHASEFVVGAAFAAKHDGKEGHFHVVEVGADGKVKLRHDETGNERWIAGEALRALLHRQHADSIKESALRREGRAAEAARYGSSGQRERAEAGLKAFIEAFPQAEAWLSTAPQPTEQLWAPSGTQESLLAIAHIGQLINGLAGPGYMGAGASDASQSAVQSIEALHGALNPKNVARLTRNFARYDKGIGFDRIVAYLRGGPSAVPGLSPSEIGGRLHRLREVLLYEHAKMELAIDRKEDLRVDVALFLDEVRTGARKAFYSEAVGTRSGLEALLDITGQVRTRRGIEAMRALLAYRGGPAVSATTEAAELLKKTLGKAEGRLAGLRDEMNRRKLDDLVSTTSRPTPELDAAIAQDIAVAASLSQAEAHRRLEGVESASQTAHLGAAEVASGRFAHRFSQLRPSHSEVKRLFRDRFGVRIALEDAVFDDFVLPPRSVLNDPAFHEAQKYAPRMPGAEEPGDKERASRWKELQAASWGLYSDQSADPKAAKAASEIALAEDLSREARADALRAVYNALLDMESSLGGRLDLSGLPLVVADRFVSPSATAHYSSTIEPNLLDRPVQAQVTIEKPRSRFPSGGAADKEVEHRPHVAIGMGVDKSLAHEIAHHLDNRTSIRLTPPDKLMADGLLAWAHSEASGDPGLAAVLANEKSRGVVLGRAWAFARSHPGTAAAIAQLDREVTLNPSLGGSRFLSNVAAELVRMADSPAWQTPAAQALRRSMLDAMSATALGRAQVELQEAVKASGALARFDARDASNIELIIQQRAAAAMGRVHVPKRYFGLGTEVVARSVELHMFFDGLSKGRINTALNHQDYGAFDKGTNPYFSPEEWAVVGPKVGALLTAFRDNMTKAQADRGEHLGGAALLARVGALVTLAKAEPLCARCRCTTAQRARCTLSEQVAPHKAVGQGRYISESDLLNLERFGTRTPLEDELNEGIGEALWAAEQDDDEVEKGAGHKYIRREAKPGGGWRYYYRASGVTSVRGDDDAHFAPGAKFAIQHAGRAGHFEIVGAEGDQLTVRHDETGHTTTLARATLAAMFAREHAHLVEGHKDRLKRDLAVAREKGTPKQVARLLAEAKRHGHTELTAPASPKVIERSPAAASRPAAVGAEAPASLADVPVGAVVQVGAKRFERVLSSWAEVDAKGKRTGSVLTFKRLEGLVAAAGGFKAGAAGPAATAPAPAAEDGQLSAAEQRQREEAARRSAEKRRKAPEVEAPPAPKPAPVPAGGEPEQVGLDLGDKPEDAGPAEHVEVGSHVAGSRKDLAGLSTGEVRDLPIEDAARVITRDKLLPTWSEASMKAAGAGPGALLLLRAIRRAIPPKPEPSVLNDPAQRMAYVEALAFMGRTFDACKSAVDVDTALREWGMLSQGRKRLGEFTSREAALQASREAYANTVTRSFTIAAERQGMVVYHREAGRWTAFGPLSAAEEEAAEREGGVANPYLARSRALGPAFRKLMRAPDDWDDSFRFRGKVYANAFVEGQKADREGWPKADDEDATGGGAAGAPPKRTVFRWQRDAGPAPVRLGGRPVESADAGAMAAEFGLHNVQFGLWATQEDRDHHLRACHGALRDLSDLLGLPPSAITLQRPSAKAGRMPLSIGIAARGKGTAAAHYEPFSRDEATGAIAPIINLTRFTGGGSLAHEWGHFLDNVISEAHGGQRRRGMPTGEPGYLSEGDALDAVDPAVKKAILGVMGAIKGDRWTPTSFHLDAQTLGTYWSSTREMFARGFESYIEDKLAAASRANTYLATGTQKTYVTGKGRRVKVPTTDLPVEHQAAVAASEAALKLAQEARNRVAEPELAVARARARGRMVSVEVARRIYERADQHPEVQPLWAAYRAANAQAREARQAQVKEVDAQPYPQGNERVAINAAFDRLFEAMRADRTLEKALDLLGRVRALAGGGR